MDQRVSLLVLAMVTYANMPEFKRRVQAIDFHNRGQFLREVKFAHIVDTGSLPLSDATRAVLFAQVFRLMPKEKHCAECDDPYNLFWRSGKFQRRGPRHDAGCAECNGKCAGIGQFTLFESTWVKNYMDKLDCLVMWTCDYDRKTILFELPDHGHKVIDKWLQEFRQKLSLWYEAKHEQVFHDEGEDGPPPTGQRLRKKPAFARSKKLASARSKKHA